MKTLKELKVGILFLTLLFLLGFTFAAAGAQKTLPREKKIHKTYKPAKISPKGKKPLILVPNLISKTEAQAKKELKKLGLKIGNVEYQKYGKGKPHTVVQQKPKAKTKVARGSRVNLWILKTGLLIKGKVAPRVLKKGKRVTPKIVQKGKKVYLEFPLIVKDVTIKSTRGKRLQNYKRGARFDITRILSRVKGNRIRIKYTPLPNRKGRKPLPPMPDEQMETFIDLSHFLPIPVLEIKPERITDSEVLLLQVDSNTIDNGEPGNNQIGGAVSINTSGTYKGHVGGNDAYDFIKYSYNIPTPTNTEGFLITASVISGDVTLTLYDCYQTGPIMDYTKSLWFGVQRRIGCQYVYLRVTPMPSVTRPTPYAIRLNARPVVDPHECNDSYTNAIPLINLGDTVSASLGKLWTPSSFSPAPCKTHEDWIGLNMNGPGRIKISITNVKLPGSVKVKLELYRPDNSSTPLMGAHDIGSSNSAEFTVDIPGGVNGMWRILVKQHGPTNPYGPGRAPECYTSQYVLKAESASPNVR